MHSRPNGEAESDSGELAQSTQDLEALVMNALDDDKAEDVVAIDLTGKSSVTDVMVIASGRSNRHVGAMADHLVRKLKDAGHGKVAIEGLKTCDWVLIDAFCGSLLRRTRKC